MRISSWERSGQGGERLGRWGNIDIGIGEVVGDGEGEGGGRGLGRG